MPNNTPVGFFMGIFMTIGGFFLTFDTIIPAIICLIGVFGCMIYRSFQEDHGYYIPASEVAATEAKLREAREKKGGCKSCMIQRLLMRVRMKVI